MIQIKIIGIGKTREPWLQEAIGEYERRLRGRCTVEWVLVKDNAQLLKQCEQAQGLITLDERGDTLDSIEFSESLFKRIVESGGRTTFVIGGAEGLPPSLKKHRPSISLSRMTFANQLVRLILMEQLYRAHEIERGSPYHKQ